MLVREHTPSHLHTAAHRYLESINFHIEKINDEQWRTKEEIVELNAYEHIMLYFRIFCLNWDLLSVLTHGEFYRWQPNRPKPSGVAMGGMGGSPPPHLFWDSAL